MKVSELIKILAACPQTSDVYVTSEDGIMDHGFAVDAVLINLFKKSSDKSKPIEKDVLIIYEI